MKADEDGGAADVTWGVMIEEEKEGLYVNRRRRGGDEMISEGDEGADFIGWGLGLCVGLL